MTNFRQERNRRKGVIDLKLLDRKIWAVFKGYPWVLRACVKAGARGVILGWFIVEIFQLFEVKILKKGRIRLVDTELFFWEDDFKQGLNISINDSLSKFDIFFNFRQLALNPNSPLLDCLFLFISEFNPLDSHILWVILFLIKILFLYGCFNFIKDLILEMANFELGPIMGFDN